MAVGTGVAVGAGEIVGTGVGVMPSGVAVGAGVGVMPAGVAVGAGPFTTFTQSLRSQPLPYSVWA